MVTDSRDRRHAMTTFGTFDIDSVPAPSDCELGSLFTPFVGVIRNRLVTIVARTSLGNYCDRRGYIYRPCDVDRDLAGYAARKAADARDLLNTQADALR